jgi:WD40 repeat protein
MRALVAAFAIVAASTLTANASNYALTLPCDAKGERISRDASTAAVYCPDKSVPIIALPSGKVLRTLAPQSAMDGLIAPDGAWLVLLQKNGTISAWPTHGTGAPKTWSIGVMPTTYLFLANGMLLIDRTLWDVPNGRAVHTFDSDFDVLNGVAMDARNGRVATAGADTTIRGYENHEGWKPLFVSREMLMEPFGIAFTMDGSKLVAGGADYHISVLDAATGRSIKAFPLLKDYINDIVPLAANDWVAVQFANDRTADPSYWRLLNLASGEMHDICGKDSLVRFTSSEAWCFSVNGRSLRAFSEPLPHG